MPSLEFIVHVACIIYCRWILNSWFLASWINVNKKVQIDATVCRYLFTAKSLYTFRVSQHPSSGGLKTVTATSGIGHNTGTATSFQRGLIRPRWKKVAAPILWPIPEVAVTVFSTPDDGRCDARNMYSDFAVNKCLHTVASSWTFLLTQILMSPTREVTFVEAMPFARFCKTVYRKPQCILSYNSRYFTREDSLLRVL